MVSATTTKTSALMTTSQSTMSVQHDTREDEPAKLYPESAVIGLMALTFHRGGTGSLRAYAGSKRVAFSSNNCFSIRTSSTVASFIDAKRACPAENWPSIMAIKFFILAQVAYAHRTTTNGAAFGGVAALVGSLSPSLLWEWTVRMTHRMISDIASSWILKMRSDMDGSARHWSHIFAICSRFPQSHLFLAPRHHTHHTRHWSM